MLLLTSVTWALYNPSQLRPMPRSKYHNKSTAQHELEYTSNAIYNVRRRIMFPASGRVWCEPSDHSRVAAVEPKFLFMCEYASPTCLACSSAVRT